VTASGRHDYSMRSHRRRWPAGPVNAFTLWKPEGRCEYVGRGGGAGRRELSPDRAATGSGARAAADHLLHDHPQWQLRTSLRATFPAYLRAAVPSVTSQESVLPIHDANRSDGPAEERGGAGSR